VGLASHIPEEAVERVKHLLSPPACTACPFHAEVGGMHYCSFDPCWTVKKRAWIAQDLARVQRKRALKGIALYDRKADGPKAAGDYSGDGIRTKIRKALNDHQLTDLRLNVSSSPAYNDHDHTGSQFVQVVLVGKGAVRAKKRREAPYDWQKENEVLRQREAEIERVQQAAAPHFAALFAGFKDWSLVERLLRLLARDEIAPGRRTELFPDDNPRAKKATRLVAARRYLGRAWVDLYSPWGLRDKGGKALVKHLQGVARTSGVQLPKGWAEQALSVAADTAEEAP
jgi:hypothetical protein